MTLTQAQDKSPLRLRIEALMLGLGMAGALIFIIQVIPRVDTPLALVLAGIVLPAMLLALQGIRRAHSNWQLQPAPQRGKQLQVLLLLVLAPLLLGAGRIGTQEAAMWWYGHDLIARAEAAAARIARGAPYCVVHTRGVTSFASLDARRILIEALAKHHGLGNGGVKEPHFWIRVGRADYWWSFRQGDFIALPHLSLHFSQGSACPEITSRTP